MAFGLRGLSHIVSTGCTSSTDAMAYAAQHIALGRQDVMLTGGVDAPIAPGILAAFNLMTVLTNDGTTSRIVLRDRSHAIDPESFSAKARGFTSLKSSTRARSRRADLR
jgi:3-oxoacyl-(acyl-carrier-protein) synthase